MAELTYTLTEKQFCDAQRLYFSFKPRWLKWLITGCGILGLPILGAGLLAHNYILALAGFAYSCLLGFHIKPIARLALYGSQYLLRPRLLKTFRNSPSLHQQSHVALRDGVLHVQSENGQGTLPWKLITHWAEDKDSLLLYLQPRLFIIVPKDVDPQSHFVTPLREQLLAQVGQPRQ